MVENKMALYRVMVKNKTYGNDIWSLCKLYVGSKSLPMNDDKTTIYIYHELPESDDQDRSYGSNYNNSNRRSFHRNYDGNDDDEKDDKRVQQEVLRMDASILKSQGFQKASPICRWAPVRVRDPTREHYRLLKNYFYLFYHYLF